MTISLSISNLTVDGELIDGADVSTTFGQFKTHLENVLNGAQDAEVIRFIEISTPSTPASGKWKLYFKSTGPTILNAAGAESALVTGTQLPSRVCNTRLTLTSGTPVTTSDVTAATSIYVTPYKGNLIALYTGSTWAEYSFSEITISLSGQAADKNYDVFVYLSGGNVVAETVVWTNDTTRATALAVQDGVYVKSGTTTKRYIGTYRTTSTIGQCEDSLTKRYVWNYYNRVQKDMFVSDTTDSWTYATATWHSWNNSTSNRASFVRGVNEDVVHLAFAAGVAATAAAGAVGIGLDSTSSPTKIFNRTTTTTTGPLIAAYDGMPPEGFHFLQLLEFANGGTATFTGDGGVTFTQSGASGLLAA